MGLLRGTRRALLDGKRPYFKKVLATGPIAYWPQWELTGAVAQDLIDSPNQDGAYTGVTLNALPGPDGSPTPFFDGANDFNNIFSATLQGAFDGDEGTVAVWARVFNAGVWTDGAARRILILFTPNPSFVTIVKQAAANTLRFSYRGNLVRSVDVITTLVDFFHVAMTWSISAGVNGEMRAFFNGVQQGATQVALGPFAGVLSNTRTVVGADNITPGTVWHGYLAHPAVWDRPLTPAEIASLAVA
jgi:hypothetical protein